MQKLETIDLVSVRYITGYKIGTWRIYMESPIYPVSFDAFNGIRDKQPKL